MTAVGDVMMTIVGLGVQYDKDIEYCEASHLSIISSLRAPIDKRVRRSGSNTVSPLRPIQLSNDDGKSTPLAVCVTFWRWRRAFVETCLY